MEKTLHGSSKTQSQHWMPVTSWSAKYDNLHVEQLKLYIKLLFQLQIFINQCPQFLNVYYVLLQGKATIQWWTCPYLRFLEPVAEIKFKTSECLQKKI